MRQDIHKTFALILISFYLLLPATLFAQANPLQESGNGIASVKAQDGSSPQDGCPCSEAPDVDCCENACHCCCHAPLAQLVTIAYSPFVICLYHPEYHQAPPQVYLPIFVPPQNFSA